MLMKGNQIAVFGSAFNPPHRGHEDVIAQARGWADKVILVPSYSHAFGKKMLPFELRVNMVEKMLEDIGNPENIVLSNIEKQIASNKKDGEPIYTFDVLEALEKRYKTNRLTFVVGPDNASPITWQRFYRAQDILARWSIWAAEERVPVRSSKIREKLAKHELPNNKECSPQVIALLKDMKKTPI